MQVGSLGNIPFDFLTTPTAVEREVQAALAEHAIGGGASVIERTGRPASRVRFSIRLLRAFSRPPGSEPAQPSASPEEQLAALEALVGGQAQPLFWGQAYLGDYVVERLRAVRRDFVSIDADVDLIEIT